ncbi:predicted protein [Naegleria gruberi]|uniref:Predicted protein n=1 Tax=Naegleria gruberi TaxID=5762 RepID=D2VTQ2_NAEGR|nr:uncharacterized protein NAEGRDRAFT_72382 [Naegleria gruberi]EFC39764.1 predicted protein [Naegleria gruberi]|eukprot:XP_002672508.1 predicted protein [Naegleria gruberi strain NEG-M]
MIEQKKEEETIEDNLPSSSSVISSFTMLNSNNKRRFSMTNHPIIIPSQIVSSTNDKNANEKKKEKKRKLKKQNKLDIFHFFKGSNNNTSTIDHNHSQFVGLNITTTSNQLIEQNISKLDRNNSIELDFDFNIVDKPITSNTCYMTNCLTTSSVDYSNNSTTFSTNVHNNATTTYETPLDRILLLNESTKLTSPALSKNISPKNNQEKNQLHRGKPLKLTSNEGLFFVQPLKSKHSSISNGDKRRRVGDENNESMILSDGISPTNSFTVLSDEPMITSPKVSPKLDQSFVEEFL